MLVYVHILVRMKDRAAQKRIINSLIPKSAMYGMVIPEGKIHGYVLTSVGNARMEYQSSQNIGITETEAIGRCGSLENYQRGLKIGDCHKKDGLVFFRRRIEGSDRRSSHDSIMTAQGEIGAQDVLKMQAELITDTDWMEFARSTSGSSSSLEGLQVEVLPASNKAFAAMQDEYDTMSKVAREAKRDAKAVIADSDTIQEIRVERLFGYGPMKNGTGTRFCLPHPCSVIVFIRMFEKKRFGSGA